MLSIAVGLVLQMQAAALADDSLLRDARAAQARFESVRRANLPRTPAAGPRPCHATIGRFCNWSDESDSVPPKEPVRIAASRDTLIARLDSLVAKNPADPWIHGQRTRYLIEGGRAADALARLRDCRAEGWWCAALQGLALHVGQHYVAADSVYSVALRAMPSAMRCEWTDLRTLATGALAKEIDQAPCEQRERIAEWIWRLAQPLWSTPGNDARTEHLARWTMSRIQADAATPFAIRFGNDNHEMTLRYGWSEWFTRSEPTARTVTTPAFHVTGHGREPAFAFFPILESMRAPVRLASSSWRFRDSLSRTRYAPRHVKAMTHLPHQIVRIRRGDSLQIVAAFRVEDSLLLADSWISGLHVLQDDSLRSDAVGVPLSGEVGALRIAVPPETTVVSIEVAGTKTLRAARARYTLDPLICSRACLSDLLLFVPASHTEGIAFEDALKTALTGERHKGGTPLGVYWELYGGRMDDAEFALTVTPSSEGRVRRLATRLRLAPERTAISLRWRAAPSEDRDARSVVLRLPEVARGKYRVVLTITGADGSSVTSERAIELTR